MFARRTCTWVRTYVRIRQNLHDFPRFWAGPYRPSFPQFLLFLSELQHTLQIISCCGGWRHIHIWCLHFFRLFSTTVCRRWHKCLFSNPHAMTGSSRNAHFILWVNPQMWLTCWKGHLLDCRCYFTAIRACKFTEIIDNVCSQLCSIGDKCIAKTYLQKFGQITESTKHIEHRIHKIIQLRKEHINTKKVKLNLTLCRLQVFKIIVWVRNALATLKFETEWHFPDLQNYIKCTTP